MIYTLWSHNRLLSPKMSKNVKDVSKPFRLYSLSSVLSNYNFTTDAPLHLDVLKDLCLDTVTNDTKLHLLLLLEEQASTWLSTAEDIEQVVGSLQSLYKQLCESKNYLLSRQILITSTVILLTASNTDTDPLLCDLLYKHVDSLLQIITSMPFKNSPLIKLAACQCLQEIEAAFPGISFSSSNLESIWTACSKESTVAFQAHASLLAQILHNTSNPREQALRHEMKSLPQTPGSADLIDRTPIAMYLVDLLPLLSPATLYTVLSYLMCSPEGKLKAFALNLQIWIPYLFQSNYLPLNHLAFCALQAGYADEKHGLKSLLENANHPLTPVSQRLLILDWIETALKTNIWNVADLPKGLCWAPNAFDGADSQGKKLKLLSYVYSKGKLQQVLLQFLESLQEVGGRATVVLFRCLLHFYSKLHSIELENHICRVSVELLRVSFGTIQHLLDFVGALQTLFINSHLTEMILDRSVSWMTEVSKSEAAPHLDSYLYALQKLAVTPESAPARIKNLLQYLHGLIGFSNSHKDWLQGHKILDAVTALLHRSDIMLLYSDLGEVLFLLLNSAVSDIDVKNRAKICYAALTSVTSQNLQRLLPPNVSKGSLTIPHFLSDHNTSTFPSAHPLQVLPPNVLLLKRCKINPAPDKLILGLEYGFDLNLYYEALPSVSVPLQFELLLCRGRSDPFCVLYGLHLQVQHAESTCLAAESIIIPALTEDHENKGYMFTFKTTPLKAQPLTLKFIIEFTTANYQSYRGDLQLQQIPIKELLLPLPVQAELRATLFEELWKQTSQSQQGKESACSLNISSKNLYILWKEYFVSTESDRRVAMFLVPRTHILIHLTSLSETNVQILFKTDNWQVMPWFINYLNDIN